MEKLVSIITVVYNNVAEIEETLLSVEKIKDERVEYVVVDGNSNDGTLDIINKYSYIVDVFISENDHGIYDAMNKGVSNANGKYLIFINSGDKILKIPFDKLVESFNEYDMVLCSVDCDGSIFKPRYNYMLKFDNTLPHQGIFYKNISVKYDLKYKVFSDFDFNQKCYKVGKKANVLDCLVAEHKNNGISNNKKYFHEIYIIIINNYNILFVFISFFRFKVLGIKNKIRRIVL